MAIVHCVGSRDRNFNNYCSAICCMQSMKFAHLVREHTDATVYEFYIDIRAPGQGASTSSTSASRRRARIFIRGRVAEVTDVLRLPEEAAAGRPAHRPGRGHARRRGSAASRWTWSSCRSGLEPQPDAHEVARRFGITCSSDGWVIERHPKLDPVATMTEGVFAAGCALGPAGHPRERRQRRRGRGPDPGPHPAARDGARAGPGDRRRRSAARAAGSATTSARSARSSSTTLATVTEVNPALCQGCGVCVAACPAGAIRGTGFSDAQILAQIEGLLMDRDRDRGRRPRAEAVPA